MPGHDTTNPAGLVQGGILAACLDDVMGPSVFSLGREGFFVTVSMTVSFLGKAEPGHALVGEATVVRAGRRHLHVEARLVRESDGAEVARYARMGRSADGFAAYMKGFAQRFEAVA